MPINNQRKNAFDENGLNNNYISSTKNFNFQEDNNLNFSSRSSFYTNENYLEPNFYEQRQKSSKSKKSTSAKATKADLAIQNASAPNVAAPGSTIKISYQVKNKGKNSAGFNYTDFYLSKDATISDDDSFLGWNWIGGLDAGSSVSQSHDVTLDGNITSGNYYILYRADALDNVLETKNNNNNIAARQITITSTTSGGYNSTSGYGLIDASAAVAKAIGQNKFADVPDLGGNNWGADLVKAPEAWAKGYTGEGVVVAVVDSGVDYNHSDLSRNIWTNSKEIAGNGKDDDGNGYIDDYYGWNFDGNNNNTLDVAGHGTHVAGTVAGVNNDFGVTGIAYNAKIMPVKVLDDQGYGSYGAIADGIRYAVDNGADVINLSLGGDYPNNSVQQAIEYASSKGAIVVMAAGNDNGSQPGYPARYANNYGIAVGAVDKNKNMADFSNRAGSNQLTYVTAPGVNVYSTITGNQYAFYNGTSMATPHVAGVVALMLSANPNLTDAQVRQILAETSGNSTTNAENNATGLISSGFNVSSFGTNNTAIANHSYTSKNVVSLNTSIHSPTENTDGNFIDTSTWSDFWSNYKYSVIYNTSESSFNHNYAEIESMLGNNLV